MLTARVATIRGNDVTVVFFVSINANYHSRPSFSHHKIKHFFID